MKTRYVTGAVVVAIGVIGAVVMVDLEEKERVQAARNRSESNGERPIARPHGREGAPVGAAVGGETTAGAGQSASGTPGGARRPGASDPGAAERAARAGAVSRAAGDAARADRVTERDRSISRDDVVEAMAAVKPLMKTCYDQMLDDFPEASGRVVAKFTVRAEDEIGEVDVVEFLGGDAQFDARMNGCMTKALDAFTIPMDGEGELTVSYPFTFTGEE